MSADSLEKILNDALTDSYNDHISSRLESLRGWTAGDEWAKGFQPYFKAAMLKLTNQLVSGCETRDDDQFVRGKIAAMKEVIDFRDMVLRQIDAVERNKKADESRGAAGY